MFIPYVAPSDPIDPLEDFVVLSYKKGRPLAHRKIEPTGHYLQMSNTTDFDFKKDFTIEVEVETPKPGILVSKGVTWSIAVGTAIVCLVSNNGTDSIQLVSPPVDWKGVQTIKIVRRDITIQMYLDDVEVARGFFFGSCAHTDSYGLIRDDVRQVRLTGAAR